MRKVLQSTVSSNKRRYLDPQNNFDLDLTYVCDRVIAMSLPCVADAPYRNDISDVARFFATRHYGRCVRTRVCACVCVFVCVHVSVCVGMYVRMFGSDAAICVCKHHTYTNINVHKYIHTYIHTYIQISSLQFMRKSRGVMQRKLRSILLIWPGTCMHACMHMFM